MTARTAIAPAVDELEIALASDEAFAAWHRRTMPRVYAYLFSRCGNDPALSEDLTQQTFLAAIEQRARFDGRSDTVTWLCGIARHKLADHFRALERQERRRIRLEVREIEIALEQAHAPAVEDRVAIAEALRSLPPAQRSVLALVVLDDQPVADAARLMGRSLAATQSLLHRARDGFRRAYRGDLDDD